MQKHRVLVVGLGSIGRRHVKILGEVADCRISVLREKAKVKEDVPGVDDYLFSWDDVEKRAFDFAVISNPSSLHMEAAVSLAAKGIPFLLEKPVCVSLKRVPRLLRIVHDQKLPVLVGFNLRYHVLYKKIKDIVSSRKMGRLLSFLAETGQYLPDWRTGDYAEASSASRELGGGVIFDLAHELDLAVDLQGKVDHLFCWKDKLTSLRIDTEDIAEITLAHQNRSISHIHLDYIQKTYTRRFKLIFEKGEILWDYSGGKLDLASSRGPMEIRQPQDYTRDDTFRSQLKHWLDVLQGKAEPLVSLDDGIYVSRIALLAHQSSDRKRGVKLS